jgi:protein-S-isoprenylcysteine O-methyltransferase Ste14
MLLAYGVFRIFIKRFYTTYGQLNLPASSLQLVVFLGYFSFPGLYNPPEWITFWKFSGSQPRIMFWVGLILISLGLLAAFGIMAWFGIKRAFGMQPEGLIKSGPYQISRNPQILGGYLMALGTAIQQPSWYALGWVVMGAFMMHWMVITEEEHLLSVFGEEYVAFCQDVPRYIDLRIIRAYIFT